MTDSYTTQCLGLGPVAYWTCGDTSGTVLTDSANANSLVMSNTYSLKQPSIIPSGSTGSVLLPSSGHGTGKLVNQPILTNLAAFSLVAWLIPITTPSSGYGWVLSKGTEYQIGCVSGLAHQADVMNNFLNTPSDTSIPNGVYMLASTYSASIGTITLYMNGVAYATTSTSGNVTGTGAIYLGGSNANGNPFIGYIQHVAIFNKLLTAAQIQALFNTAYTGNPWSSGVPVPSGIQTATSVFSWSSIIANSNSARKRVTVTNDSDAVISVSLGLGPAVSKGGIQLAANGGRFVIDDYTGPISAIHTWPGYVKNVCIMEE